MLSKVSDFPSLPELKLGEGKHIKGIRKFFYDYYFCEVALGSLGQQDV